MGPNGAMGVAAPATAVTAILAGKTPDDRVFSMANCPASRIIRIATMSRAATIMMRRTLNTDNLPGGVIDQLAMYTQCHQFAIGYLLPLYPLTACVGEGLGYYS